MSSETFFRKEAESPFRPAKPETQTPHAALVQKLDALPVMPSGPLFATHEEYFAERNALADRFGKSIADLSLSAKGKMMHLQSLDRFGDHAQEIKKDSRVMIGINVNLVCEADIKKQEPWKNYKQELPELRNFSEKDFEDVRQFIASKPVPPEYQPYIDAYLVHMRILVAQLTDENLYAEAREQGATTKEARLASLLRLRQEAYPLFSLLSEMDTEKYTPVFESVRTETVAFLQTAFPDLDAEVLKQRSEKITFKIESAVENIKQWEGIGGTYGPADHVVTLRRDSRFSEQTYRHEILHGLSQSDTDRTARLTDPELSQAAQNQLTEAIIEEITQFGQIDEVGNTASYVRERSDLLNKIRRPSNNPGEEIPLALFVKALFRNEKNLRTTLTESGYSEKQVSQLLERANRLSA